MIVSLMLLACSSGTVEPPPRTAHFGAFDGLVRATSRSDVAAAKQHARDLSVAGPDADADAVAAVGAAAGFLQVASAPDDLSLGVAKAAAACGGCHSERALVPPDPPRWMHETAAVRAAWGVVWGQTESPPGSLPEPVRVAWGDLAEVLTACQSCHPSE